ncbi:zinc finger CCCH-type antiviral protein 1 isoform X2 [Microcaecilia unicolor]|uniref:Zinc finger CCCH-type antiviral protein 1-like isoform X2 n=1 Tax=Microcaecilia unicolor TaxID=1415580 RepID=A0A6P7Z6V4_9AMPH|nr:zinc finger CCCH-type antiviral protein 1-like isoform X2 [Microcaecilia unicolor]
MSDPVVAAYLTKLLCANGGCLPLLDIPKHLALSPVQISALLAEEQSRFLLLEPGEDRVDEALVLPLSPVRVCIGYLRQQDECQGCDRLHLCRFFVLGKCRIHCRLSHDIHSECNKTVLKANEISGLNEEELRVLLLQNDSSFLPEVCFKYKGSEQAEACEEGDNCRKLHVCRFFTRGECRFFKCKRSHNLLDPIAIKLLRIRGLRMEVVQNIQLLCNYRHRETCREWTERDPLKRKEQPKQKSSKQYQTRDKKQKKNQKSTLNNVEKKGSVQNKEQENDIQKKNQESTLNNVEKKGSVQNKEQEKDIQKAFTASRLYEGKVDTVEPGPLHTTILPTSKPNVPRLVSPVQGPLYATMHEPSKPNVSAPVSPVQGPLPNSRRPEIKNSVPTLLNFDERTPDTRKPDVHISVDKHTVLSPRTHGTIKADTPAAFTASRLYEGKVDTVEPGPLHTTILPTSKPNVPRLVSPVQGPLYATMHEPSKPNVSAPVSPVQGPLPNSRRPEIKNSVPTLLNFDERTPDTRKPDVHISVDKHTVLSPRTHGTIKADTPAAFTASRLYEGKVDTVEPGPLHTTILPTSKPNVPRLVSPVQGPLYATMHEPSKPNVSAPVSPVQGPLPNSRRPEIKNSVPTLLNFDERTPDTRKPDVHNSVDKHTVLSPRTHGTIKADTPAVPPRTSLPKPTGPEETESSKEICLFNVWKFCKNTNKCPQMHFYLPYRWEILRDRVWEELPMMEEIEKAYCDPNNISSGTHNVDFEKMTCAFIPVRRLSTASSVTKPTKFQLTTEWLWYWKNEYGQWIEYGKQSGNHKTASSLSSFGLENVYLADKEAIVSFQAGSQSYEINFADMVQKNVVYMTKREIRRRPKFLSYADVLKIKMSKPDDPQPTSPSKSFPPNWDRAALPVVGYKMLEISSASLEYKGIQRLFENTMSGYCIQNMKRIQNPSLWEVFQWQKEQMKKLNGGKEVCEKMLFHGTNESNADTICYHNFDWRICGVHGTLYGKGSYFARDASYSHNYCTSKTSKKSMFVARVLVGDFTSGNPNFLRPPTKFSNSFYDSCVDKVSDPSIFVVFEKHQIYPEYVLEYVEGKKCCIS